MGIPLLRVDDQDITDRKEVAGALGNQYDSVFTDEDLANVPDLGPPQVPPIDPITVTTKGVLKLLKGLDHKKWPR